MNIPQILEICPFLALFEGAWPAEGVMRQRLQRFRIKPMNSAPTEKSVTAPHKTKTAKHAKTHSEHVVVKQVSWMHGCERND